MLELGDLIWYRPEMARTGWWHYYLMPDGNKTCDWYDYGAIRTIIYLETVKDTITCLVTFNNGDFLVTSLITDTLQFE